MPVRARDTMTLTEQGRPNPRGEAMVAELRWVHDMIRRDLGVIRQMAADTEAGRPASAIRGAIRSLASGSAVWQLKVSCLQHCRFVHSHHTHESLMLFPALRTLSDDLLAHLRYEEEQISGTLATWTRRPGW